MSLRQYEYALAVAEQGSVTAAAELLHVAQPSVSQQIRGLEREEIMAIGDNLNDLEMLDYAGRAVVMANASEEIRALARRRGWELTASNDDDGVARAIEEVLSQRVSTQDTDPNGEETIAASPVVQFAQ